MHLRKWDAYRVYLILSIVSAMSFSIIFTLNMIYEAEVVGLTPLQLVLVGTTLEIICFTFEIPTGIVADLYSRRLSVIIGFFLIGIGFLIEGSLPFFWAILLAQVFWGIGATFTSGALEAWIVDEVGEARMGPVFLRGGQAAQIGAIIGIIVSVALGGIALALPVIVGALIMIALAVFLTFVMPERGFKPTPREERNTWHSMAKTLREGLQLVRGRGILLIFLLIALVGGLYSEGFDRLWQVHLLREFTLPGLGTLSPVVWFGIIGIVGMLLGMAANEIVRRRVNMEDTRVLARLLVWMHSVLIAALLVFALAGDFALALAALLLANVLRGVTHPIMASWTNRYIESGVRATVLSSFSQLNAVGQIAGGPVVGVIGDRLGLRAALSAAALLLAPMVWLITRAARYARVEAAEAVEAEIAG
jgi:DHA3 family tetracycline resistance protein-like MFS transporter